MKKILIVDDEPSVVRLIKMSLEKERFEIRTANGGREALELLGGFIPDLVVLDILMPDINGLEVCREIRRKWHSRQVKVLFLSAKAAQSDVKAGFAAGADEYIIKPFNPKELTEKIRSLL